MSDDRTASPRPRSGGHPKTPYFWGVNSAASGFNVLRGLRRPDGGDEGEM